MKANLIFYLALFLMTASFTVQAQDTIIKRNGEVIKCLVKEIGTSEIKYTQEEFRAGVVFTVDKKIVKKIVFSDGKIFENEAPEGTAETIEKNSQDLFLVQKKNALKFDFISLVNNVASLTYERCLKPGSSLEFSLGIVGIGIADKEDNASGILFRGGYKLMKSPDFYLRDMRYAHILKGSYAKLEFDFASYGVDGNIDFWDSETQRYTLTKWAFLLVMGKQWIFNDNFLIDLYSGIGIGRNNLDELDSTYPYAFATLGKSWPLALSYGIRFGFLIK